MENPRAKLIDLARLFIGVTEDSPNKAPLIEMFQKTVDGKAQGEPYCVAFIQYLCRQVDFEMRGQNKLWKSHQLKKTESAVDMWHHTPKYCRAQKPGVGSIVVWQWFKTYKNYSVIQEVPTRSGHAGVVCAILESGKIQTIEANTSPEEGQGIVREGDGVWTKERSSYVRKGEMQLLGFLNPWVP